MPFNTVMIGKEGKFGFFVWGGFVGGWVFLKYNSEHKSKKFRHIIYLLK